LARAVNDTRKKVKNPFTKDLSEESYTLS
ncbi:MAG: hypothetical protein ACJAZF_002773, partial [Granulosicoccus sp.]